jgi:hypothetical protein
MWYAKILNRPFFYDVNKNGNKLSHLNAEDRQLVNTVLIKCAAKMSDYMKHSGSLKKHAQHFLKAINRKENLSKVLFVINLVNLEDDHLYSHEEFSELIFRSLLKESPTEKLVKNSTMSKALKTLCEDNLLINIRDRAGFKAYKRKQRKSFRFETEGRFSRYILPQSVQRLKMIMSDHNVLEYIQYSLLESGLLYKFLIWHLSSVMYILKENISDEVTKNFLKAIDYDRQMDFSELNRFKDIFMNMPDIQIESLATRLTQEICGKHFTDYPLSLIQFLFAVTDY